MKLGKVQKAWIESMKKHPQRQMRGSLGTKQEGSREYRACCLGELLITSCRIAKKRIPFHAGTLQDISPGGYNNSFKVLSESYEELGIKNPSGAIDLKYRKFFDQKINLAEANDGGISWTKIAELVEKYPQAVFNKSV